MSTKYQVVADAIRERIENGTYKIDELIPDQNALAQEFHVNRLTVKKALDGLAAEGLIYKQSGLGTYVRGKIPFITPHDVSVNDFGGAFHHFGEGHIQSKVISFDVELPDERIQKNLSIKHIDPVYNITRLRIVDGKPTVLEHTYMPVRLVPDLEREHVDTSIYTYINETLGLKLAVPSANSQHSAQAVMTLNILKSKKAARFLNLNSLFGCRTAR